MTLREVEQRHQKNREAMMFEAMVEAFIHGWAPDDPRERAEFAAGLQTIVRQVYADAQAPVLERFSQLAMALPYVNPITATKP